MNLALAAVKPGLRDRVWRHVLGQLLCLGRHTVTGVLATAGRLFRDWSADYRLYSHHRVDPAQCFGVVRRTVVGTLAPTAPVVVGVDDTQKRKWGTHIPGVQYLRDPLGPPFQVNLVRAQRFVQLSLAAVGAGGLARMIPIDFVHAPPGPKPKAGADPATHAACRAARQAQALPQVAAARLQALRASLDAEGQHGRPLWVVGDGGYTNRGLLKHLPERTVFIGRTRSDAKLYSLPIAPAQPTGRPKVYGPRAPTPQAVWHDPAVPWQEIPAFAAGRTHTFKVKTLSPFRWRPAGAGHNLRLLVVAPLRYRLTQHSRLLYRDPAFLLCTDPAAPLPEVLQAYLWRWDIEPNFRDEKTLLGVGQAQVRHPNSVGAVPALAVAAYALLLTAALQAFGLTGLPGALPPPKWRRTQPWRPPTQALLNLLRHEVWSPHLSFSHFPDQTTPDGKPQQPDFDLHSAVCYRTG